MIFLQNIFLRLRIKIASIQKYVENVEMNEGVYFLSFSLSAAHPLPINKDGIQFFRSSACYDESASAPPRAIDEVVCSSFPSVRDPRARENDEESARSVSTLGR